MKEMDGRSAFPPCAMRVWMGARACLANTHGSVRRRGGRGCQRAHLPYTSCGELLMVVHECGIVARVPSVL